MGRARHARWKLRSGEERVEEYEMGISLEDRPQWSEKKRMSMEKNYRDVATALEQLDEKVRRFCGENMITGWECVNYMRVARKAWSLAHSGYMADYVRDVLYLAQKYNIPIDRLNSLLEYCGLPTISRITGGRGIAPAIP